MRIALIADTHGFHRQVEVPDADILIHAGDFTNVGELEQVHDFNKWLGELPHKHKVVIAGNHDRSLETIPAVTEPMLTNCIYLRDEACEIEGLKIWGSPWTPWFSSDYWKFHLRGYQAMKEHWDKIPEDLDVLITHGPPNRMLDKTSEQEYAGDNALTDRLRSLERPPKIHVFGHIHEGYGERLHNRIHHFNASVCTRVYRPTNKPWVIEL